MNPRTLLPFAGFAWLVSAALAAEPITIPLWPDQPPGETAPLPPEVDVTTPADRKPAGRPVIRISNVSTPTLTVYKPDPAKDTGAAVLVCPGGGYVRLAMDIEGTEVCDWLNSIGVTGVLLKYRVPRREGMPQHLPPGQDAQRAMGVLRQRAAEFGIDPHRIGIIGFSAGAHVAAVLSAHQDARLYPAIDAADALSCRPDFALLIYPGYFTARDHQVGIAPEVAVTAGKTPPTFLAMAEDDPVHVENALFYYLALKQANVSAEMHLYPTGGHGFGLRRTDQLITSWPDRAADWLRASGWLNP
ncbi:alpha/beta hydrolase [Opitutus terrae]|uniref:Xylanase n=1 Tax=Opitutus terrae (strain DSM 11246 / JCM 15787 / PB90-1) TaxID=452637 RepID=B1ZQQ7_OPITP|nr:alpha/beta hydrolase [Opitutus terrae]ACB77808.1 xylanase [Opitutus terrae PB90-1]